MLGAALAYAARGWSVIPIWNKGERGKIPAISDTMPYQTRPAKEIELRGWFCRSGVTGLAVFLGAVSGNIACRDFDQSGAYEAWAAEHRDLARTLPTAKTFRGHHVYFRWLGIRTRKFIDGELRGEGCYTLLPPSQHPSGLVYTWVVPLPDGDLPEVDPQRAGFIGVPRSKRIKRSAGVTEPSEGHVGSAGSAGSVTSPALACPLTLEDVLNSTQPTRAGEREECLLELARAMKFNVQEVSRNPRDHELHLREWHRRALPVIGTKPFDDTWFAYLRAFDNAKFALGTDILTAAACKAARRPQPACAARFDTPEVKQLISVCAVLQEFAGAGTFSLSCHQAGALLGCDPSQANRWLNGLVRDGVLTCTWKAPAGQLGPRRSASRYRYAGDVSPPTSHLGQPPAPTSV